MSIKDLELLAALQLCVLKNPHHYTFEKLQADTQRQGWSTAGQVVSHAENLGFKPVGFLGRLTCDNKPGAMELAQMINYVLEES